MPRADRSDPAPQAIDARIWRAVESQHVISTMRLVGHVPGDQAILEEILEAAKPPVPTAARHLHWLLATPFRYAPVAGGSRFRARGDPGVFYGAAEVRTACAEAGYWKWRFVRDSAGLSALEAHPMTLFPARVRGTAWHLTQPPFAARRAEWMDPVDYASTQALARRARATGVEALVYASVRDPAKGECTAVLVPAALVNADPMPRAQSWFLTVLADGVVWQRQGTAGHRFDFTAFAA